MGSSSTPHETLCVIEGCHGWNATENLSFFFIILWNSRVLPDILKINLSSRQRDWAIITDVTVSNTRPLLASKSCWYVDCLAPFRFRTQWHQNISGRLLSRESHFKRMRYNNAFLKRSWFFTPGDFQSRTLSPFATFTIRDHNHNLISSSKKSLESRLAPSVTRVSPSRKYRNGKWGRFSSQVTIRVKFLSIIYFFFF